MLIVIARENMALTLSAVAAAVFALAGISWGWWIGSLVILFDGAYSLVSVVLSLLSLYAARVVRPGGPPAGLSEVPVRSRSDRAPGDCV